MEVRVLDNGLFSSNTWLVGKDGVCVVIDCGAPCADILSTARDMGCRISHILLTHGHVDHTCQLRELKEQTGAIIGVHPDELSLLHDLGASGYAMFGIPRSEPFPQPDLLLDEDVPLDTGAFTIQTLHTPGHTAGCVCLLADNHLFTGDTLFHRGVGRTDLPTGNSRLLVQSLKDKLYRLDAHVVVHPGHGPDSTIGEERTQNPHVSIR